MVAPSTSIPVKRDEFFNSLETYSILSKSRKKAVALILIDIENFPIVNLQFGYKVGEQFIKSLYYKIEMLAKYANCTFRINDSAIALVLPVIESESMLVLAANKILNELKNEIQCERFSINAQPRIGMSASESESSNPESLYREAQEYLIAARESGQEFVLHLEKKIIDDFENFSERFQSALYQNDLELYYQPKKQFIDGCITHAEALLRWQIEENQFVSPERMVSEAEKSSENNFNLTKWVVNNALKQMKKWRQQNIHVIVSVNVSPTLIHRSDFISMVSDALNIWGIDPSHLMIEITETAFMEKKELCSENLNTLKNMGVNLSIDDFGTGYSSLSYFKEIPANELKIDKAFVLDMMESEQDRKLVRLMVEIAHSFDLKVVAEGIESRQAYNFLQEINCDYAQGYYIAKPMEAERFSEWYRQNR